ncbi:VanZ family protein [Bowmanella dokdonensis]|uniref:VanZ-like domain-containing protein n=1 Tax=Bowmanella dokdonensis TaxID=751969 RepID=A0A939DRG2_9ALTE|nr:hypothetical protein [Bowmanella dokdonensis]MBN7827452.1 hypothetical protein [Bowmanella dokdonensis]
MSNNPYPANLVTHPRVFFVMLLALTCFCLLLWVPIEYLFIDTSLDKHYHLLFFTGLTLLCRLSLRLHFFWLVSLLILFAVLTELSQFWIAYRHSSWGDLQANLLGIALGFILSTMTAWRQKRKRD